MCVSVCIGTGDAGGLIQWPHSSGPQSAIDLHYLHQFDVMFHILPFISLE